MNTHTLDHRDYRRIAAAIRYIDEHWQERPALKDIARAAKLSPFHFNRLFRRWAGVTPKQYLQWLALDAAKLALKDPEGSVLAAAYAAGCSGPGRLHDLFVTLEAMTPGEYRAGGAGVTVRYGFADSPFGPLLAARTERGICHMAFADAGQTSAIAALAAEWPRARLERDDEVARAVVAQVWGHASDEPAAAGASGVANGPAADAQKPARGARSRSAPRTTLTLAVRGTNFQLQVWRALLAAGERGATSYGALARDIGAPRASRAVGGAVGDNPVAWIIPCHRVLRTGGGLGGYRWDPERKRTMLAWEYARQRAAQPATTR